LPHDESARVAWNEASALQLYAYRWDIFGGGEEIEINRMAMSELERERGAASQIEAGTDFGFCESA